MTFDTERQAFESRFETNWTLTSVKWPNVKFSSEDRVGWVAFTNVTDESKDHIRWAESHEGINIYLSEDNRWGIKIEGTKCKHLCDDGRCGIQDNKPKGCTEYYGMNPDGPFVECNLIKELIKNGHIAYKKEWISKLWPDQIPENLKLD